MKKIKSIGIVKPGSKTHCSLFLCPECNEEVVRDTSNGIRSKTCGCLGKVETHRRAYYEWANKRTPQSVDLNRRQSKNNNKAPLTKGGRV